LLMPPTPRWEVDRAERLAYLMAQPGPKRCPGCTAYIKASAQKCRYCGYDVPIVESGPRRGLSSEEVS